MVFSDMYLGTNFRRFLITYYWQAWKLLRLIQVVSSSIVANGP